MKLIGNGLKFTVAASALSLMVVACGGSEPGEPVDDTTTASDVDDELDEAGEDIEAAADEAGEGMEDMADDTADAMDDAADDMDAEMDEAADDMDAEMDEAANDMDAEMDEVTDASADAGAHPRVSAETVAEYEALTGNAQNGRRVFTQCMACHSAEEGRNMAGPSLYGIVGREAGSIPGFNYSDANANSGITWTEPTMFAYLEAPQAFIPGTIMAFPGLPKAQDRADVIAYLKENAE
ncbi:MAG: cytochrome c family protein [Henriciella sp.]|uniref:c-type cytochrome n=1 Tax=Henriciella sp. TaxID=1968823 RepID=UPI003C7718D5